MRPTNLRKVFWPALGLTKGDLLDYYDRVAEVLLPHLHERPIHMNRFPDGVEGKSFYHKDAPARRPAWVETEAIPTGDEGRRIRYVIVNDRDTLLWDAIRKALPADGSLELVMATAAFEAGAMAQELRPHVLIVDVTLPDVSPQTLALRVQAISDLQSLRIIGIGTGLTEAQGQALLQAGFHGYLAKPFDIRSLIDLVDRVDEVAVEGQWASH